MKRIFYKKRKFKRASTKRGFFKRMGLAGLHFTLAVTGFHLIAMAEQYLWSESVSYATETYRELEKDYITKKGYVPASTVPDPTFPLTPELALNNAAQKEGVSFCLLRAFAEKESALNPDAKSYQDALGMMQVLESTAKLYCDIPKGWTVVQCLRDMQCNADCGARIIKRELVANSYNIPVVAQIYHNGEPCTNPKTCPKTVAYTKAIGRILSTNSSC